MGQATSESLANFSEAKSFGSQLPNATVQGRRLAEAEAAKDQCSCGRDSHAHENVCDLSHCRTLGACTAHSAL
jgi:hypothetical protein